jgi:hypothetical protein
MVVDVKVLDQDAVVLLFRDIIDCGANELYSIEVSLANLLALLRRVAPNDYRAVINIERWRVRGSRWLCEGIRNQS